MNNRPHWKTILTLLLATVTLVIISLSAWLVHLDRRIGKRLADKRFLPPVEFYAAPMKIRLNQSISPQTIINQLRQYGFRQRDPDQPMHPGDFALFNAKQCQERVAEALSDKVELCVLILSRPHTDPNQSMQDQLLIFDSENFVIELFVGQPLLPALESELEPRMFAQFYGDKPILRTIVDLGETPMTCLNAIVAIEDNQFLEHPGVSAKGLVRAIVRNLQAGRLVEGGSTLTQQLVKNYFLTSDRTFRRKFIEVFMAILLEFRWSKDEILATYINLIYMGQNGPFQVRGLAAAADYYFARPLGDLNLAQCSLLAAMVNSPGLFNPFLHPEAARQRREKVLEHMHEQKMITESEKQQALKAALPLRPARELSEPAPYFVAALNKWILEKGLDTSEGLRIYSTLDMEAQEAAQLAIAQNLQRLENSFPRIKKIKELGQSLEGMFLSADVQSGEVRSLVGGRQYRQSQYNRATDSHRQVGSLMKPFVYLAALESQSSDGTPYTPVSIITDKIFTYKYSGQSWSPKNYGSKYYGSVPLYFALKSSLNAATAQLGISVGLESIIDVARRAGIHSTIEPLPSLTLGAYELYPLEVLQAYSTLAGMGVYRPLTLVRAVSRLDGTTLFEHTPTEERRFSPGASAELIGMMKQTIESGTAVSARTAYRFEAPAGGKTGTTSDTKDAWFAGFTPLHVAVAWVGYDDNTPHGLTGASGAVPIWSQYMNSIYRSAYPPQDFPWPNGTVDIDLDEDQQRALGVPDEENRPLKPIRLIFLRGQEP
jgi:penicillin-binding protein 1B